MLDSLQTTGMCNLKAQKIVVLPHKVAIAPFPAQSVTVLLLIVQTRHQHSSHPQRRKISSSFLSGSLNESFSGSFDRGRRVITKRLASHCTLLSWHYVAWLVLLFAIYFIFVVSALFAVFIVLVVLVHSFSYFSYF